MTIEDFTNKADGLINDFSGGASDEKEFRDGILDLLLEVATPAIQVDAKVKLDACGGWQKEKPNKPCLMVTKTFYDGYNYQLLELNYMEDYLAVFYEDGEEWGDYNELKADEYFIIEYFDSKPSV